MFRLIAVEAIKDSDLSSRTSPARRDPLEPPFQPSPGKRSIVPSPKLPNACGMSKLESPARLLGAKEPTPGHNTLPADSQDYLTECAMRGFVHERLTEILPSCVDAGYCPERHRREFVQEWNILPADARERYKTEPSCLFGPTVHPLLNCWPNCDENYDTHFLQLLPPLSTPNQDSSTTSPLPQIARVKASATTERPELKVLQQLSLQNLFAESTPELLEAAWLQAIGKVQSQAAPPKTIVGVVGNTGAGKSSIINAVLDEERLVQTNCMRACTAVFITREGWEKELRVLFHDLFDGIGNVSREASNEKSEAGVAYAKMKAVYPKFTREMLQNSSVEQLMWHRNVQNVLGSTREIAESDSLRFYKKPQFFVDRKEKTTGEKDKDKKPGRDLELTAFDQGFDDKAAKSLLGDTFKRQLKMDGGFNTVTFICNKTDDTSLIECQESLGLEEEMGAHWAKSDELAKKRRVLKQRLEELKESKAVYIASADETVFAPRENSNSKKRKRSSSNEKSGRQKKARTPNSDAESDYVDSDRDCNDSDDEADDGEDRPEESRVPLI
ncbi:uncharacterized protein P174DRAFT_425115 [Aspergillus novofumigatus IBT 16806]|uniref:Uncharacterized protein n=1 Tax=Aspergillus novofumigatus (strain IBT 16806) TaxID=1392255 RepID=A0A2I1BUW2_ASPN1|nr:uncharacterized protein P174DRAFT_425115 [Aspergillus novofumigatus IBT 16806]PKX89180.1 hypothetical protein P174DRAFT_425115 [Aspergillus novofumigatus IBT 16806]